MTTPILTLAELDEIEHDIKSGHVVFGVQNCAVTNSIRLSKIIASYRALLQRQEAGEAKAAEIPPMTQDEFQTCFDLSNALNIRTHTNPGAISVGECFNLLREAGALSSTPPNPPSRKEIFSVLSKFFLNKRALHECADLLVAIQQPRTSAPPTAPSRDEIAKEIASFACRRHLINSNAYEALADRIFALINGASK